MEPAALPNGLGHRLGPCDCTESPNDSNFLQHQQQQHCRFAKSLVTDSKLMEDLELAAFPPIAAGDDVWSRLLTSPLTSDDPSLPPVQCLTRPLLWCTHCQTTVAPCDVVMRLPNASDAFLASLSSRESSNASSASTSLSSSTADCTYDSATSRQQLPSCHFAIETGLRVSDLRDLVTPSELAQEQTTPLVFDASLSSLPVLLLAWTTAPWSLALNEAMVLSPQARYCLVDAPEIAPECETHAKSSLTCPTTEDTNAPEEVKSKASCFLISADALSNSTANSASLPYSLQSATVLLQLSGAQLLERVSYVRHPVLHEQSVPLRGSALVHPSIGTGIVHVVPGCSDIDYQIGLEIGLISSLSSPIDADGCFDAAFSIASLRGASFDVASDWVLQHLRTRALLYHVSRDALTAMPYCLACSTTVPFSSQQPLFYRTLKRWFCDIKPDVKSALTAVLSANETVFLPKRAKKSLLDALDKWLGPDSRVCFSACIPTTTTQQCGSDAAFLSQLHPTFRLANLIPFFAVVCEPSLGMRPKLPNEEEKINATQKNDGSKQQPPRRSPYKSTTPKAPPQPRSHVFYCGAENVPPSVLFSFLLRLVLERPALLTPQPPPVHSKKLRVNPLIPTFTFLVPLSRTNSQLATTSSAEESELQARLQVALAIGTSPLNLSGLAMHVEIDSALQSCRLVCADLLEFLAADSSGDDSSSLPPLSNSNNCVIRSVLCAAHLMATKSRAYYAALDFQSAYSQLASFAREMETVFVPLLKFFSVEADVRACVARVLCLFLPALTPLAPSLVRPFAESRTYQSISCQLTTTRTNPLDSTVLAPLPIGAYLTLPNLDPSLSASKQEKFHWTHALRVREVVLDLARAIAPPEKRARLAEDGMRFRVRIASANNKEVIGFLSWLDLFRSEFSSRLDMLAFLSAFLGLRLDGEILIPDVSVIASCKQEGDANSTNAKSKQSANASSRKSDQSLKLEQVILVDYVTC